MLFSLGQHAALQAVQRQLAEGELLFTFLDDVYAELYVTPASASMGAKPNCGIREASAQIFAMFWRSWGLGSDLPAAQQGVTVLGTLVHDYAEGHNAGLWRCLAPQQVCTPMMVRQLSGVDDCESPSLQAASRAAPELTGVEGFEVPSCVDALVRGARPPPHEVDEQALLRSQSGPMAGIGSLPALPTSLPASNPTFSGWSCCAPSSSLPLCAYLSLWPSSTPLAIIELRVPELGYWGRGFAIESDCAAKEANVMHRDLDLPVPVARGGRRLEIITDGLPLFGGAQLTVDATSAAEGASAPTLS